jgi:hypothetical protein
MDLPSNMSLLCSNVHIPLRAFHKDGKELETMYVVGSKAGIGPCIADHVPGVLPDNNHSRDRRDTEVACLMPIWPIWPIIAVYMLDAGHVNRIQASGSLTPGSLMIYEHCLQQFHPIISYLRAARNGTVSNEHDHVNI